MTHLLKLALVGRPNVGKSALFNRISGKRIAIVDEAEGITRDRLYTNAEFFGKDFEIIDTGGIHPRSKAPFNEQVKQQAEIAIEEADVLVMVVDAHVGVTDLDKEVAQILLKTDKPLCVAINKIDNKSQEILLHEFHSLGIPHLVAVSATHNYQIAELLETAFAGAQWPETTTESKGIHIAIVGRPNVGKSTLINHLVDEERCIASPVPGTTRDSIDISFEHNGQTFTLIDTAGIRRKHSEHEVVDKFASLRTTRAIERAHICLLMIDSVQGMTAQEKRIATQIEEEGKGCILLFNKWDLVKGFRMEHCLKTLREDASFLAHCPTLFISAETGRNVDKIFEQVEKVYEESVKRISTPQLNKCIALAMQRTHPPMITGKRLRVYYLTQIDTQPPTFIFFVNRPDLMIDSYKKYLYNQIRATYKFSGVPLVLRLRGKYQKPHTPSLEDLKEQPTPTLSDPTLGDGEVAPHGESSLRNT